MDKSYELFLVAAKELNFTKAAKKSFVTQQCVSDHISRLEKKHNTQLFFRKPYLSLTAQGESLLKAIYKLKILESNLENEILELNNEEIGSFSFGINTTRARILVPKIISKYKKIFPKVEISIILNETQIMEKMVINGDLDCFLGVNTTPHRELNIHTFANDPLFLIISTETIKACLDKSVENFIEKSKNGIDIKDFDSIPFVLNLSYSTTSEVIKSYLLSNKILLNNNISISDYDTQFALCRENIMATICPKLILQRVFESNNINPQKSFLHAFPIIGLEKKLEINFVTNNDYKRTKFINAFLEILKNEIANCNKKITTYF